MNWKKILTGTKEYYTDIPDKYRKDVKTTLQWITNDFYPIDENVGILLYPNEWDKNRYKTKRTYLHISEVKKLTPMEIRERWLKEKKNQ